MVTDRASLGEGDLDTALVKLADDIADAGEFRDEEAIGVSHTLRHDVLVRPFFLGHSGCVQPGFVHKGG